MKKSGFAVVSGLALALAAGCSATPVEKQKPTYEPDLGRIALIEHIADKRGVRVIWVNAPTRAVF
jgi:hypothetical protein